MLPMAAVRRTSLWSWSPRARSPDTTSVILRVRMRAGRAQRLTLTCRELCNFIKELLSFRTRSGCLGSMGYQMKSGAEPRASLAVRGGALFDRVDYRPIETPEAKDQLFLMRYRAYTRGGLIPTS